MRVSDISFEDTEDKASAATAAETDACDSHSERPRKRARTSRTNSWTKKKEIQKAKQLRSAARKAARIPQVKRKTVRIMRVDINPLSKNDTTRKGHQRLCIARADETATYCVVRRLEAWLRIRAERQETSIEEQPLFPTREGKQMHADTPRGRLRFWMQHAGIDEVEAYGFHSLRAGGATEASRAGVSERDIQRHGNWATDIARRYMHSNIDDQLRVSRAHAQTHGSDEVDEDKCTNRHKMSD